MHCDTISKIIEDKATGLFDFNGHISIQKLMSFTPAVQNFAFFGLDRADCSYDNMYNLFINEMQKNKDFICQCKSSEDIRKANSDGKIAALLSIEGAELIECDINRLERVYNDGVRSIMLTWNYANRLSGSNAQENNRGLSDEGRKFVEKCIKFGILNDVSHLSDRGFYDIFEIAVQNGVPFIASHSNSRTVCPHKRNLTDDMFKKLMEASGVAGINAYSCFLCEGPVCRIDNIISHIEHFLDMGGSKNIGLGFDLDGCDSLPKEISDVSGISNLYDAMLKRNYSEELINDIFYNNFFNVLKKVV